MTLTILLYIYSVVESKGISLADKALEAKQLFERKPFHNDSIIYAHKKCSTIRNNGGFP